MNDIQSFIHGSHIWSLGNATKVINKLSYGVVDGVSGVSVTSHAVDPVGVCLMQ